MTDRDWEDRWGARVPLLIVAYVAALMALRLWLSPFLEVDEADFMGQTDLRLVYGNAHPPLYNWLLAFWLWLTGNWALSAALVKYPLLAAFHLLTWDAARRLGGARAGLYAVAASAFCPQIVWMSALTLTHSIMILTGVAGVIHGVALCLQSPSARAYVWLGLAAVIGALAKYNFALFLFPFLIALAATPGTRALFGARFAISVAVFAALTGPVLVAALMDLGSTTSRVAKLFSTAGATDGFDVPGIGLDGFLSMLIACIAWAGPLALVWWIAGRGARGAPGRSMADRSMADRPEEGGPLAEALGRAMILGLLVLALIVLAADMTRVRERYLTPILAAAPIWIALARPISARWLAGLAGVAYAAALAGVWATVTFGGHRLLYPWADLASQFRDQGVTAPGHVIGQRHADGANFALALGTTTPDPHCRQNCLSAQGTLLVWRGRDAPTALIERIGLDLTGMQLNLLTARHGRILYSAVFIPGKDP